MTCSHPAARNSSTTNDPRKPAPPVTTTRRFCQKPTKSFLVSRCWPLILRRQTLLCVHHAGHGIMPAIPLSHFLFENLLALPWCWKSGGLDIRVDHDGNQVFEPQTGLPSDFRACPPCVSDQRVNLQGPEISVGGLYIFLPIKSRVGKCFLYKFAY